MCKMLGHPKSRNFHNVDTSCGNRCICLSLFVFYRLLWFWTFCCTRIKRKCFSFWRYSECNYYSYFLYLYYASSFCKLTGYVMRKSFTATVLFVDVCTPLYTVPNWPWPIRSCKLYINYLFLPKYLIPDECVRFALFAATTFYRSYIMSTNLICWASRLKY